MREDLFHTRCACEPVRVVHLRDSAIGVRRKVQQVVGQSNACAAASGEGLGCTKTTAWRRSSSSKTGSNPASPRYTPLAFVNSATPSSSRTSSAYANSLSDASTSGSGRQARLANRSGRTRRSSAANSLQRRASVRALTLSPVSTPGVLSDTTATSMLASSMNEMLTSGRPAKTRQAADWSVRVLGLLPEEVRQHVMVRR